MRLDFFDIRGEYDDVVELVFGLNSIAISPNTLGMSQLNVWNGVVRNSWWQKVERKSPQVMPAPMSKIVELWPPLSMNCQINSPDRHWTRTTTTTRVASRAGIPTNRRGNIVPATIMPTIVVPTSIDRREIFMSFIIELLKSPGVLLLRRWEQNWQSFSRELSCSNTQWLGSLFTPM